MNIKNFKAALDYLVQAELTPFIWGDAGIGKSSVVKQYANSKGYKFFPLYLGTMSDIGDILGLAEFVENPDGSKSTAFATPKWLVDVITYCNENPDSGAVIFLDEFNRGRKDIHNGMFSLALDKTFHTIKLPKNCHVVAAGNPPTDEYFVTDVNETALMARFVHVKLEPTFEEWVEYAKATNIEPSLLGFLRNQPQLLEQARTSFDLNNMVKVDRRAFERLDKLFKVETPSDLINQLMPGIIGLERTVAYMNYLKETETPLSGADVLNKSKHDRVLKWSDHENIAASYLNLTCENLEKHLAALNTDNKLLSDEEKANLFTFFTAVPKDISYPSLERFVKSKTPLMRDFIADPKYAQQLIDLIQTARGEK